MHWRLNKYVVNNTVDFLRRIFSYNSEWSNKDIEIFKFDQGKDQLVYEAFANNIEKYPAILIIPTGGNFIPTGFNDLVRTVDDDIQVLGVDKLDSVLINDTSTLNQLLPSTLNGSTVRGIKIDYAWDGTGTGGDDLQISITKGSSSLVIASASVEGHTSRYFENNYADFSQDITFDTNNYYINIQSTSESPYYLCIDPNYDGVYTYNNTQSSGSVVGDLYLSAFFRIGGNFKGGLSIKCMDKNNTKTPYELSELIAIYLNLAKHAQINRQSNAINGMSLSNVDNTYVAEFMSKGINISEIRTGALETRTRSPQEIIYTIPVNVDFLTEWFEDFPVATITNIEVLIKSFIEGSFEKVIDIPFS